MIKQDYLLRMIQEIITLLINALLNRQKIRKESWVEYDDITRQILEVPSENLKDMSVEEIIQRYEDDPNRMGKTELAAMTMLKIADEMEDEHLVLKSRLKQDGEFFATEPLSKITPVRSWPSNFMFFTVDWANLAFWS